MEYPKVAIENKVSTNGIEVRFRLTKRDEELFLFLLDQKFASLEMVYLKYFDRRKSITDPTPPIPMALPSI